MMVRSESAIRKGWMCRNGIRESLSAATTTILFTKFGCRDAYIITHFFLNAVPVPERINNSHPIGADLLLSTITQILNDSLDGLVKLLSLNPSGHFASSFFLEQGRETARDGSERSNHHHERAFRKVCTDSVNRLR